MKQILNIKILVLIMISITYNSCTTFLDEIPDYNRTTSNSYKDEKSLKSGLVGAYSILKGTFRANTFFFGILGTDEAMGQANTIYNDLSRYKVPANDSHYISVWYERHFKLIAQTNTLIANAVLLEQTENVKYIINECKVLRAFAYFRLVQIFGPVTLQIDPLEGVVDYGKPRAGVNEVYAQIIKDLEEATQDGALPETVDLTEAQRPTIFAARALLGKVYVTLASTIEAGVIDRVLDDIGKKDLSYSAVVDTPQSLYKKAEVILGGIVNSGMFKLNNHYGDVFCIENNNKISENIWQIQFASSLEHGQYFMMVMGMWTDNGDLNTRCNTNGLGLCQVTYPKHMYYSYSSEDVRRDWNLACRIYRWEQGEYQDGNPEDGDTENEIVAIYNSITKFRQNSVDEMHTPSKYSDIWNKPTNQTIVRYADVLLLYTEAGLRANGGVATPEGINAINQIRQRARGYHEDGAPITVVEKPTVADYATVNLDIERILEERKLELCYEGYRWFDLVRYGKLIEKYNEPVYPASQPLFQQIQMTEKKYLFQIPQSEIDGSTNPSGFFQNPL